MGRSPCCDKTSVKKGPWSLEEDQKLKEYIEKHGTGGNWVTLPQKAGLQRCGKSCRLRWLNYLRPNIKHGEFSDEEDKIICSLYANIGSRWSRIAAQLPGRTDNDVKNYWNTKLQKKLMAIFPPLPLTKPLHPSFSHSTNNYPLTEPIIPFSSSPLNCTGNTSFTDSTSIPNPQDIFVSPLQHHQVKDSPLVFGGETTCSSSDGSFYNYGGSGGGGGNSAQQMGLQGYFYNGVNEKNQNSTAENGGGDSGWSSEKQNGLWGEKPYLT